MSSRFARNIIRNAKSIRQTAHGSHLAARMRKSWVKIARRADRRSFVWMLKEGIEDMHDEAYRILEDLDLEYYRRSDDYASQRENYEYFLWEQNQFLTEEENASYYTYDEPYDEYGFYDPHEVC